MSALTKTTRNQTSTGRVKRPAGRQALVVLGMHRSGTSALCGALDLVGVDFGNHLMPANEANEKGYWEHEEIVRFHDDLLSSLGSHWDDDRPLPADWLERDVTKETQSCLVAVLRRDFGQASLLGLKDPRMSRLIPLWFPIFAKLGIEPHFALTVRQSFEVARSLAKRDGLDLAKSYLLWLGHIFAAESATRGYKRAFVQYDAILANPVAALTKLQNELALSFRFPDRVRSALREFVEPSMRHHHFDPQGAADGSNAVPRLAVEVFEATRSSDNSAEIAEKLAPLSSEFARGSELFYPRVDLVETVFEALPAGGSVLRDQTDGTEQLVRLEIFHPVADGYRATDSQTRYFPSGSWKVLGIELQGRTENSDRPLRIDPASYPAVIDIAEIALKRPISGEIVWSVNHFEQFDAFQVAGTAFRMPHEKHLRILSFGGDPQILLPLATAGLNDVPLRLELSVRVDPSAESITASLAALKLGSARTPPVAVRYLEISADAGDGTQEEGASLCAPLEMEKFKTLTFQNIESLRPTLNRRLRIDPLYHPALLRISSIRIVRDSDGSDLYRAETAGDFDRISVSHGATKLVEEQKLLLGTATAGQQIHLPGLDVPAEQHHRLEIQLEAFPSAGADHSVAIPGTIDK